MTAVTAEAIASRLQRATRTAAGWTACCPAHDDHDPSLSISERDGKVLLRCHAGCSQDAVVGVLKRLGAWPNGTAPARGERHPRAYRGMVPLREHAYADERGEVVFFNSKYANGTGWRPWSRTGDGWACNASRRIPYRLPDLLASENDTVILAEGEKDADTIAALGWTATSFKPWKATWNRYLDRFATLVAIGDDDGAGDDQVNGFAPDREVLRFSTAELAERCGAAGKDVSELHAAVGSDRLRQAIDGLLAAETAAQSRGDRSAAPEARPSIRAMPGDLAEAVAASLAVLAAERDPLAAVYARANLLTRAVRLKDRLDDGGLRRPVDALTLRPADADWLALRLSQVADFYRTKGRKRVAADPPPVVCRAVLAACPWDGLPQLTGIIEAPTILPSGRVIQKPGYDAGSGLLFDPGSTTFAPIPERPSRLQAESALEVLMRPFADFPFVDDASRSVALSAVLTALVRRPLRAAPLFAYTAPKMASGKTLLATVVSYVACGRAPYLVSQADDATDERKRLLSALLEGPAMVVIDNCDRPLKSDSFCTVLTEPTFTDRLLGVSKTATVMTNVLFATTGNNLELSGDLSARALLCTLDPACERPEEREFGLNLHEWAPAHRGELAAAALTVIGAYLAAGEPKQAVPNFARFEQWQRLCRFPLTWLGLADPCATRAAIEATDPVREGLRELLSAWHEAFGDGRATIKGALDAGQQNPLLQAALENIAGEKGGINARKLGRFIARHARRIEGGLRFEQDGGRAGVAYWRARGA